MLVIFLIEHIGSPNYIHCFKKILSTNRIARFWSFFGLGLWCKNILSLLNQCVEVDDWVQGDLKLVDDIGEVPKKHEVLASFDPRP